MKKLLYIYISKTTSKVRHLILVPHPPPPKKKKIPLESYQFLKKKAICHFYYERSFDIFVGCKFQTTQNIDDHFTF